MYPRANQLTPQSISLTTKKRSAQRSMVPPTVTRVGKAPNKSSVLPSSARQYCDLEILFGQCAFGQAMITTVLAADHRPAH